MRVLHSAHLNVKSGGPALSAWLTIKGLRHEGVETEIVMPPICDGDRIIDETASPRFYSPTRFGSLAYVPKFDAFLNAIGDVDIYHAQGVWMLHSTQMARYARKHGVPYVVTLRGMLYPQALAHNPLVKKLSLLLYQGKTLRNAAAIQCTCIEEMQHYRNLGFKNPVAVIPNPIEVEEPLMIRPIPTDVFRIGYLGRIHPRKRVERLIYALDYLLKNGTSQCELLIIGGGDEKYENFLKSEVQSLGLTDKVKFTGFISGKEKDTAIKSLSILAVPSDFENFGNIVTEALVRGVPVIASTGMPWQTLPEHKCGWWIDNDQDTINRTIAEARSLTTDELLDMGRRGQELMKSDYSVEALAIKMKSLYNWILGKEAKPDFVYV